MYFKIISLASLFTLSIPASFAKNTPIPTPHSMSQQKLDSEGESLSVQHLPFTQINVNPLLNCQRNNIEKIFSHIKLASTRSDHHIQVSVELKNDGNIKKIQTSGKNNDIVVKSIKKAIFKSSPFTMPTDEAEIHLCNQVNFDFYSEYKSI